MIELEGITKSYGKLQVLKGVSLQVGDAEIVSVVGPSGAGKTTLLQIMGTLDRPDGGSVRYDGTDVLALGDNALSAFRNHNIGFVFQLHRLLPEFTMLENVAMPALIAGTSRKAANARARELLEYLGLADRMDHRPAQLSGGECQRTAVARALMNKPRVVLADEPSGSLDSHNRRELQRLFMDLRADLGVSFVIVTHDESLAGSCDRIIHLRDGLVEAPASATAPLTPDPTPCAEP